MNEWTNLLRNLDFPIDVVSFWFSGLSWSKEAVALVLFFFLKYLSNFVEKSVPLFYQVRRPTDNPNLKAFVSVLPWENSYVTEKLSLASWLLLLNSWNVMITGRLYFCSTCFYTHIHPPTHIYIHTLTRTQTHVRIRTYTQTQAPDEDYSIPKTTKFFLIAEGLWVARVVVAMSFCNKLF